MCKVFLFVIGWDEWLGYISFFFYLLSWLNKVKIICWCGKEGIVLFLFFNV